MTRARLFVVIVFATGAIGAVAFSGVPVVTQAGPPVFRSRSTSVSVDVSVRSGNRPVANLSAADFVLTDNGVPQQVELVDVAAVPLDVSLVVDLSGSTYGSQGRYRNDVAGIARIIRAGDRLRVIAFSRDVEEILPLSPAGTRPPVERLTMGTSSSVFDGIAAAILRRVELGRRHLVVAFTDGGEGGTLIMDRYRAPERPAINIISGSIVSLADLIAIARRSESVLHLSGSNNERLNAMAEDTGGGNHGSLFRRSIRGEFEAIYASFRQSYVLRYSPSGVEPGGWHEIAVGLARPGQFEIRARRGYFGQ
jgi:hypothetical protein